MKEGDGWGRDTGVAGVRQTNPRSLRVEVGWLSVQWKCDVAGLGDWCKYECCSFSASCMGRK